MTDDITVQGTGPRKEPSKHLNAPFPTLKAALLSVAMRYDESEPKIAAAFRDLAAELHHWF
jgi:hypothetical protein